MYRRAIEHLKKWKEKTNRKPLIIRGARQVGKSWLMNELGRTCFKKVININCDNNPRMVEAFSNGFCKEKLLLAFQAETGIKVTPDDSLIILDEIQEIPNALKSLKYLNEQASEFHVIAAGSLLGIALHEGTSFPVGKVEYLDLYPLSFEEFLLAKKEQDLFDIVQSCNFELAKVFKTKLIDLLKEYYYVGGMPEVVDSFINNKDFSEVRTIQERILFDYEQDFSKHAPKEIVPRIRALYNSLPKQLAKENKKFIYGLVKEGARAREYEIALSWLIDCGLLHRVDLVTKPELPLKSYVDGKAFKLYSSDIGLLGASAGIEARSIIEGNKLFTEFKGSMTEQYVLQQLKSTCEITPFYWSSEKSTAEIDFLFQLNSVIYPLEVKAETNLKAKSLKVFCEKFENKNAIRISMSDYKQEKTLTNFPLYKINSLRKYLGKKISTYLA
ncbi:MAG: ATP-binding protein [Candidatus Riflebacteria bacterium]|nr:ATP-binding protein [Candidatus Riflebacteria bacterium]